MFLLVQFCNHSDYKATGRTCVWFVLDKRGTTLKQRFTSVIFSILKNAVVFCLLCVTHSCFTSWGSVWFSLLSSSGFSITWKNWWKLSRNVAGEKIQNSFTVCYFSKYMVFLERLYHIQYVLLTKLKILKIFLKILSLESKPYIHIYIHIHFL